MARPLPPNSTTPRNGSHALSSLAADLALSPPADDDPAPADLAADWGDGAAPGPEPSADESAALREQVAELGRQLADLRQEAELALAEQQGEFERVLEEKTETIRTLHDKLQERPAAPANTPREEELLALSEELERERQQLKEDEEALMQQMGQMEVQMSRERAELARQRSEMQRLQSEIRHELELAARDAALRERLAPLQRRQQELDNRRVNGAPPPAEPAEASAPADGAARPGNSGLFRRLFG